MDKKFKELRFAIVGMDCAGCASTIEKGVASLADVNSAALTFTSGVLKVEGTAPPERIISRVRELGYDVARPPGTLEGNIAADAAEDHKRARPAGSGGLPAYLWSRWSTRLALLAALLIIPGLLFDELLPGLGVESPVFALMSVLAMAVAGYPIALSALRALRINREITINLLMTVAAVGAVIIGAYVEAGLVMVLFALGEALEGYTANRARETIGSLTALAPAAATVMRGDREERRPVSELKVGDHLIVLPGERLAMDGVVVAGESAVNQAPITGESRLVDKLPGDPVFAGSVNGYGSLEIEVTHTAEDNTISRMIRLVAEAQENRAPVQRFVDRFAKVYTPAVIVVALLVAIIPPLLGGADGQVWLYRALTMLVVACPCALVVSTPVTLISAISNGARHGVLFKGGAFLEELGRVRVIAFDKTGTITRGEPSVVAVRAIDCDHPESGFAPQGADSNGSCDACDDLVALAAAVERRSEHPLAESVLAEAVVRGVDGRYPSGESVKALSGRGITGQVNGHRVTVGSHVYLENDDAHLPHHDDLAAAEAAGLTTMLVSDDLYRGYMAVADTTRAGAPEAMSELRALGIDPLVMLTGDHVATAERIAAEVGLTDVRAGLLPEDKVAAVGDLRALHGHVAMVGDGINDTPALASASVGLALGRTDQALETADVVLLGDDLRQLPYAVRLARSAMNTVRFNVFLSIFIKVVFFVLVLFGSGSMWLAVLADVGTSLIVTANGMRLLRRPELQIERG